MITVVVLMLITGITGGTINYLLSRPDKMRCLDWMQAVILGLGSAFLMPLFLRTISSNLLADLFIEKPKYDDYLVFTGFCLLAAISSRVFIQTLSDRVLKEAKEAKQKAESSDKKVDELKSQIELDSEALLHVDRQLNSDSDSETPKQDELNLAFKRASVAARRQIYHQATHLRSANWRRNKEKMALTIPVFRALVAQDVSNQFHKNYGQLGFALKDKPEPDYEEAKAALTQSIQILRIRGDWKIKGNLHYELARAICNIMLIKEGKVKQDLVKDEIIDDLREVAEGNLKQLISNEKVIADWMQSNEITL